MKKQPTSEQDRFWQWLDRFDRDFSKEPKWLLGSPTNRGTHPASASATPKKRPSGTRTKS